MRLRAPIAEDIFLHSSLMWLDHCDGPCVSYLMLSLSRLRDHSILRHHLRHYFRACASVSFSWFDHAVPL